jgi:hypothetical protein
VANSSTNARVYAAILAIIAWLGILLQCYLTLQLTVHNGRTVAQGLIVFFGFFTVLTNIIVALTVSWPLLGEQSMLGRFLASPFAVAGVAVNIAFVAISYHLLLRHVWNPQGAQWLADITLHYLVPLLFVIYWGVYARTGSLRWSYPWLWSLYPAIYFVYVLVRGELIGTYPYGFVDVAAIGYGAVVRNAVGLLLGFIAIGMCFAGFDRVARPTTS